ncbi:DUF2628 domain-containing protein [Anaerolentibacter hominis]|uniref:DUF2628 domain-containing protein n=1 Tax=Anaerolentibacter hominis TaxID=3079009 RepID=UPI0031B8A28C
MDEFLDNRKSCPVCGRNNLPDAIMCDNCGHPFQVKENRIDGYLEQDISNYVGTNEDTYLYKFRTISQGRNTFNPCAAIFQHYWLAYRRMWRECLVYFGISIVCNLLFLCIAGLILSRGGNAQSLTSNVQMVSLIMFVVQILIFGYLGDRLYWRRTRKVLNRYGCLNRSAEASAPLSKQLEGEGNVSMVLVAGVLVITVTMNQILNTVGVQILKSMIS